MPHYTNIGIVHHGLLAGAGDLAKSLARKYEAGRNWWLATQDTLHDSEDDLKSTDLIITIGGDGTILREARAGRLRGFKIGGRRCWRFLAEDVDRWLMQGEPVEYVLRRHDVRTR